MSQPNLLEAQRRALPLLTRILRRYPNDVEDILQVAAYKALKNASQFRGDCAYQSWFTRIAINEAFMLLRHRKNGVIQECSLDGLAEQREDHEVPVLDERPSSYELFKAKERKRLLYEAIGRLSSVLQEEAFLALSDDNPRSSNTRKARKYRLRRHLRVALQERGLTA